MTGNTIAYHWSPSTHWQSCWLRQTICCTTQKNKWRGQSWQERGNSLWCLCIGEKENYFQDQTQADCIQECANIKVILNIIVWSLWDASVIEVRSVRCFEFSWEWIFYTALLQGTQTPHNLIKMTSDTIHFNLVNNLKCWKKFFLCSFRKNVAYFLK